MADTPDAQNIVTTVVAICSALLSGAVSALAATGKVNRKYQHLIDTDQQLINKIAEVEGRQSQTEEEFKAKIEGILDLFKTHDGEPRFITYPAHDHLQSNCQQFIHQKIKTSNELVMIEIAHIKKTCERIEQTMERRSAPRGEQ